MPRPAHPLATPCRSACRTGSPGLPSLSHAMLSGVSEQSLELVSFRQSPPVLSSFSHPSRTEAPLLRRHYPASSLSGRRRRPAGLTSVRLSNGSYSFPVSRFHEGVSKKKMRGSYRCRCSRRPVPATALARGRLLPAVYPPVSGPSRYPLDPSIERVSSAHEARVFHLKELIRLIVLTHSFAFSLQPPSPTDFPGPPGRHSRGHAAFTALPVLFGCPTARRASFPPSSCDL